MRGSAAFRTGVAPGGALAGLWVRNPLWRNARAVPSLDLQLADNKSLVDGVTGQNLVTFTRASSGTFVGSDGLIKTAATNEPRFDHNPTTGESLGLLVEEARTNLALQSEDFSTTWSTSTASVTTNAGIAPNETTTADKLIVNNGSSSGYVAQNFSFVSGTNYAFSVYVKSDSASDFRIVLLATSFGTTSTVIFNLTSGTVASSSGAWNNVNIVAVGNNWYRVSGNATATATAGSSPRFQCNVTGDGVTGVLLWAAQLEAGAFPTSYIPTTTATATRASDVASITGSSFSSWYNQTEGTVFAEAPGIYSTGSVLTFSDGSNNNRMLLDHGTNTRRTRFISGGSEQAVFSPSYTYGTQLKTSFSYASNYFSMANAGVLASGAPDTSGLLSVGIDRIFIGSNSTGAGTYANTSIRRLTYWPTRLADNILQQVTQ
jgi:hypothetical protein